MSGHHGCLAIVATLALAATSVASAAGKAVSYRLHVDVRPLDDRSVP